MDPLDALYYQDYHGDTLLVLLRGIGGSHHSFEREGMIDAVRERKIQVDMVAPNAHFGYYAKKTLIGRLREDIIAPAQESGYRKIWLVGVSMGGLGAMLYLRERPGDIAGVYLISPFLGYEDIVDTISRAGGLARWQPAEYSAEEEWQTMLWDWIRTDIASAPSPPVYLGYGEQDRYGHGPDLLRTALPEDQVIVIPGGHDFATMKEVWCRLLDMDRPF